MAEEPKKPMTKTQVIKTISEETGLSRQDVINAIESLVGLSYKEAANGFTIPGLGKLVLVERSARTGRNPATGEPIEIPAKTAVKFRIAKACKDAILSE